MNKTIFRSVLLACSAVMVFSLLGTLFFLNSYFTDIQMRSLKEQAELTAAAVSIQGLSYFDSFKSSSCRITWIESSGRVIADTDADEGKMDNHLERKEIEEALRYGRGQDRRLSDTLGEERLYAAVCLEDGSVLRLSVTQHSVFNLTLGVIPFMIIIFILALLLCSLISRSISRKIIGPLNCLDLDNPLDNNTYDELSPLFLRIESQKSQIEAQIERIRRDQKEFEAITDNMSEAMVILNSEDAVLSLNSSAMKLFCCTSSSIGKSMLTLERSLEFQKALDVCKKKGRSEYFFEKDNHEFCLIASLIKDDDNKTLGTCLLIMDETEKAKAEIMRREFSANVSHELKSPLQAILASSELLMNNLVKEDDKLSFIGRIHSEAEHLVTLIEDIIRLSQLDESSSFSEEEVPLAEISQSVIKSLSLSASEKKIRMESDVDDVRMRAEHRLVYEIIYNLTDNAIRYGRVGGYVKLSVKKTQCAILISVEDNGIGIPDEHQSRIFERFYRVEASHSRSTGGTGLGLSIVKHASLALGGSVSVESRRGEGSVFTVSFPSTLSC